MVSELHPLMIMLIVGGVTVFVSAFTSNTATCSVILPVVYGAFGGGSFAYLALVGTSSSLDFMLPAGTPPNAIVFSSGYVKVSQMVRIGFFLDLVAIVSSALWIYIGIFLLRLV